MKKAISERVRLVQLLCPERHCIIAAAFDPADTTPAEMVETLKARMVELGLHPWCGICGSTFLSFEIGVTVWNTVAEAEPTLRIAERENLATRDLLAKRAGKQN